MVNLQNTLNPISAAERVKINQNWDAIRQSFSSLQLQINFLSGNEGLEELINRINSAITIAEESSENVREALQNLEQDLTRLENLIQNATNATQTATNSANLANSAANLANESAQNANLSASEAENAAENANRVAMIAEGITNDAQQIIDSTSETLNRLNLLREELDGYNLTIVDYNVNTNFIKNQNVRFNGSTYRAKSDTVGNPLPNDGQVENEWFSLVAQRGVDGNGSVSSVNNILPNLNGNVSLSTNDIGAVPISHLNNSELKHIELLDALPSDYTNRGIVFRRTQVAPSAPERPDYNVELANHVGTNASKSVKGHVQIGDGLEVNDGVVSSSFYYDNTKTLESLSSSFLTGETLTAVTTSSTDTLQMAVNSVFYGIMDYTLTSQAVFRYLIKTVKRTNGGTFQEILVFGNVAGIPYEIGRLSRLSSTSTGNPWTDWKVHMNIAVVKGNPNGVQPGLRGFLVLDILNGKQYYKSTGTSVSNTNTGWLPIGGE